MRCLTARRGKSRQSVNAQNNNIQFIGFLYLYCTFVRSFTIVILYLFSNCICLKAQTFDAVFSNPRILHVVLSRKLLITILNTDLVNVCAKESRV